MSLVIEEPELVNSRDFGDLSTSLLFASNASLTLVSLRASSGVLTTVAPVPRMPLRCCDTSSMERTSLGSDILVGLDGAYGEEDWVELRDNQGIEGRGKEVPVIVD